MEDIPKFIKSESKVENFTPDRVVIQHIFSHKVHTAIIWTTYVFQLIMAIITIYRAIIEADSSWLNYISVVATLLCSLYVISWVEKNILDRDDLYGRSD